MQFLLNYAITNWKCNKCLFIAKNNKVFSKYTNVYFIKQEILTRVILFDNIDIFESNKNFLLIQKTFETFDLQKIFLKNNKEITKSSFDRNKDQFDSSNTHCDTSLLRNNKSERLSIYANTKNIIFQKITRQKVDKLLSITINYNSMYLIANN